MDLKERSLTNVVIANACDDELPFVGQLNTVFIVAVAFGMALILLAMVFQIINAKKRGDKENLFFSPNGVAGLVFYGFLVLTIVLYMTGHKHQEIS